MNTDFEIKKYPDGSSYVNILNVENLKKIFTFRINTYEDLWHLNQLVDALNNLNIVPTIKVPCLLDAQADMRFSHTESAGLRLVCEFLKTMDANFVFFHLHNPYVVEAILHDKCIIKDNSSFVEKVLIDRKLNVNVGQTNVIKHYDSDNTILMSSDAGGFKPLLSTCKNIKWEGETASASKYRDKTTHKLSQRLDREDFEGKNVIIIDDLCVYGGTFKGLSTLLRKHNVGKLYLAVSHMTIQAFKDKDHVFKYFDKVYTTNSKFNEYYIPCRYNEPCVPDNLEIIKIF